MASIATDVEKAFDKFEFREVVAKISDFGRKANTYLSNKAPWHAIKENDNENVEITLNLCIQAARALLLLLNPLTPTACEQGWQFLSETSEIHPRRPV